MIQMESQLDIIIHELAELRNKLDKAQRSRADLMAELDRIWEDRLEGIAVNADGQVRTIQLKALIMDEDEIAGALKGRIEEKQVDLKRFTHDKQRGDANSLVADSIHTFDEVMSSFSEAVSKAESWLREANEAAHAYSLAHPGDTNRQLQPKVEAMATIVRTMQYSRTL